VATLLRIGFDGPVPYPTTLMKVTSRCGETAVAGLTRGCGRRRRSDVADQTRARLAGKTRRARPVGPLHDPDARPIGRDALMGRSSSATRLGVLE
jgi:hypothetical protein